MMLVVVCIGPELLLTPLQSHATADVSDGQSDGKRTHPLVHVFDEALRRRNLVLQRLQRVQPRLHRVRPLRVFGLQLRALLPAYAARLYVAASGASFTSETYQSGGHMRITLRLFVHLKSGSCLASLRALGSHCGRDVPLGCGSIRGGVSLSVSDAGFILCRPQVLAQLIDVRRRLDKF